MLQGDIVLHDVAHAVVVDDDALALVVQRDARGGACGIAHEHPRRKQRVRRRRRCAGWIGRRQRWRRPLRR